MNIERTLESTNLLYSELLQQCEIAAPQGNGLSFVTKAIKGRTYWYLQVKIGNRQTQRYVGTDSLETRAKIESEKQLWQNAKPELAKRKKLVAMLQAGGAFYVGHNEARVLELLEQLGVFLVGGILVGSHAFNLYQNMLGVRWRSQTTKTRDIDIAENNCLTIGIYDKPVNLKDELLQSGMGFLEIPALNTREPSTAFRMRGQELKIDIFTPMIGKTSSQPILLKSLNASATPIRFLEFLLEAVQPAVVVAKAGILVNVPSPARYALHKLVVSQRRAVAYHLKAKKDIEPAAQLLAVLLEERPGDILFAWEAAQSRQDKFGRLLQEGIQQLPEDLQKRLQAEIQW